MKPNSPVLRTPGAALYVGLSESTLEKLRLTGEGPIYHKSGSKIVVYRPEDLDAWLNARRRRSTSEKGPVALAGARSNVAAPATRKRGRPRKELSDLNRRLDQLIAERSRKAAP